MDLTGLPCYGSVAGREKRAPPLRRLTVTRPPSGARVAAKTYMKWKRTGGSAVAWPPPPHGLVLDERAGAAAVARGCAPPSPASRRSRACERGASLSAAAEEREGLGGGIGLGFVRFYTERKRAAVGSNPTASSACRVGTVCGPRGLRWPGRGRAEGRPRQQAASTGRTACGPCLLAAWAPRVPAAWAPRCCASLAACGPRGPRQNRGFYLMSCIKYVPTLRGDNYTEWRKKVDFAFVCAEVDWVVDTPQPIKPTDPVRADGDTDDAWAKKKRNHAPVEMSYTLENRKWQTANKKCMAFIKNTIENAIVGSITECASAGEYLEKIKSQFTGSSKTYATQLLKQLVTEKYTGGAHGIREHILRMTNLAAKLKPMDADLELKPALLVHLVMASLPQQFDNFVINYNMSTEKWDIEKTIAMCVQEEDGLKAQNGEEPSIM
ncbi:hypothetical protein QYE76_063985 [Lolium multiflorum]|uniref:Uncharacterized protein n=1 Tax=Lolium multiflorum TaxID=4521 RepID=A0AAD8S6P3_LOLMU|nr:hypothetical protein QYE76_063985 [Lolium multiflorum]